MAKYLVLIYEDEAGWQAGGPAAEAGMQAHQAFGEKYADVLRGGEALQSTGTATSIRDGVVTDGPFVESKEALGGYYVIEADDRTLVIDPGVFSEVNAALDGADAVLITHEHPDHIDVEQVKAAARRDDRLRIWAPQPVAAALDSADQVTVVEPGQALDAAGLKPEQAASVITETLLAAYAPQRGAESQSGQRRRAAASTR